jgi:quercetin dioxygenase-like cupin family protein
MAEQPKQPSAPVEGADAIPARAVRPLAGPLLTFDLPEEAEKLRKEGPWLQHGRNAVTLVKYADLRIVLMLMKAGTRMPEHHATGRISVQTLSGHVRLHLKEQTVELPAGHLLALDREIAHDVEAIEESAVLLTIAWPGEEAPR